MAGATEAPPALVNNVETIANVPGIVANGADWFRSLGTDESPGTIVCTVSGSTSAPVSPRSRWARPLRQAIETIGGGRRGRSPRDRRADGRRQRRRHRRSTRHTADLRGDARRRQRARAPPGSIVLADDVDLLAAAAGVARFLAIESCGQCTPCKQDGLALAERLAALVRRRRARQTTPPRSPTCSRPSPTAPAARSPDSSRAPSAASSPSPASGPGHPATATLQPVAPLLVAELVDIDDGKAVYDEEFTRKQPDWTFDDIDSGQSPVDRLTDRRAD